jgi:hypothetical protein
VYSSGWRQQPRQVAAAAAEAAQEAHGAGHARWAGDVPGVPSAAAAKRTGSEVHALSGGEAVWGSLPTGPVPVGTVSDMNAKLWETFSDGCNCLETYQVGMAVVRYRTTVR